MTFPGDFVNDCVHYFPRAVPGHPRERRCDGPDLHARHWHVVKTEGDPQNDENYCQG